MGEIGTLRDRNFRAVACNPTERSRLATISDLSLQVWDLDRPKIATSTYSTFQSFSYSSLSWRVGDGDHVIATTTSTSNSTQNDAALTIWDIRQKEPVSRILQRSHSLNTNLVSWNKVKTDIFCTFFDKYLKVWDLRKLTENTEILSRDLGQNNIKTV